jgi:phosphoserine phosphatase
MVSSIASTLANPLASPLERFRAGEIDLETYLDLKVDEATAHLVGLPAEQLEHVRSALRAEIAETPELRELVREIATSKRGAH